MCEGNKANLRLLFYLLVGVFASCVAGALQAEERWYLISETEVESIEQYKAKSEAERQNWLLQASELKSQARSLSMESATLNSQLLIQREENKKLQQSFNEYEAEQLTVLSLRNGEIVSLKLEAETYKGKASLRLVIIITLLAAIAGYTAFRVFHFLRLM